MQSLQTGSYATDTPAAMGPQMRWPSITELRENCRVETGEDGQGSCMTFRMSHPGPCTIAFPCGLANANNKLDTVSLGKQIGQATAAKLVGDEQCTLL